MIASGGASAPGEDMGEDGREAAVETPNDSMGLNCVEVFRVEGVKIRGPLL